MDWINLVHRHRWVFIASAVILLSGCRTPSNAPKTSWVGQPKADKPITSSQEADLQISMGRVAERQGNLEEAMACYRSALNHDKHRTDAYARLAVLHDKQGKFRESAELYQKALASRPGDPEIFCDLGYSMYLQRRWAEAEMNLKQAIALKPEFPRAHNNLALIMVQDNRLDEALAEFTKGGSQPSQAHRNVAFALTMDQRWETARAEYQRALELDPASELARSSLNELNALVARRAPARQPIEQDSKVMRASATSLDLGGKPERPPDSLGSQGPATGRRVDHPSSSPNPLPRRELSLPRLRADGSPDRLPPLPDRSWDQ